MSKELVAMVLVAMVLVVLVVVGYEVGLALRDHPDLAVWTMACVVSGALVAWLALRDRPDLAARRKIL